MKLMKNEKFKKIAIIISIPLLLIAQYYLFSSGILRPMLKGIEIQIVSGDYIPDIDKYVVQIDETVKLSMGKYIKIPNYSKEPILTFRVLDNKDVLSIEGDEMTGLKEGYASIGVMHGDSLLKKATIKVVKPKVENLELIIDEDLVYVGDIAKLSSKVETDYKQFDDLSKVDYYSSNEDVLTIENNKVKAVGIGTATVYAKYGEDEDPRTFNIRARVASINIENKIEIEEGQTAKLNPKIITSPKGLKHPKIEYALVGSKLPISRAIALYSDGTIVGLQEGEEEIKITCGNKDLIITVKVNKVSIENKKIENLEVREEIVGNNLILTATFDYIKGVNDYELYLRNNSLNEKEFNAVQNVTVKDDNSGIPTRIEITYQIDISNLEEIDIELFVVGLNENGKTQPSDIKRIRYPKESESIKNLMGYFDNDNNIIKITWDPINIDGVTYNIYAKDNLKNEDKFTLVGEGSTDSEYTINTTGESIELEVYIEAEYNGKIIKSNTITIK